MDTHELLSDYILAIEANSAELFSSYYCYPCVFFMETGNKTFLNSFELESYIRPILEDYNKIGLKKVKAEICAVEEQSYCHAIAEVKFSLLASNQQSLFNYRAKMILQDVDFDQKISGMFVIDEFTKLEAACKKKTLKLPLPKHKTHKHEHNPEVYLS